MLLRHFSILFLFLTLTMVRAEPTAFSGADPKEAKEQLPSFQDEIRPLLQAKCWRCHGDKARKADLNLSTLAGIRKGGESGRVIVAGMRLG